MKLLGRLQIFAPVHLGDPGKIRDCRQAPVGAGFKSLQDEFGGNRNF